MTRLEALEWLRDEESRWFKIRKVRSARYDDELRTSSPHLILIAYASKVVCKLYSDVRDGVAAKGQLDVAVELLRAGLMPMLEELDTAAEVDVKVEVEVE